MLPFPFFPPSVLTARNHSFAVVAVVLPFPSTSILPLHGENPYYSFPVPESSLQLESSSHGFSLWASVKQWFLLLGRKDRSHEIPPAIFTWPIRHDHAYSLLGRLWTQMLFGVPTRTCFLLLQWPLLLGRNTMTAFPCPQLPTIFQKFLNISCPLRIPFLFPIDLFLFCHFNGKEKR